MDTEEVARIADGFNTTSQVLKRVSAALEDAMMMLKVTAFVGLVGGAAVERYIAMIKPRIDRLSARCEEISNDLRTARMLYLQAGETGDSI
jgi:hypothetical protein